MVKGYLYILEYDTENPFYTSLDKLKYSKSLKGVVADFKDFNYRRDKKILSLPSTDFKENPKKLEALAEVFKVDTKDILLNPTEYGITPIEVNKQYKIYIIPSFLMYTPRHTKTMVNENCNIQIMYILNDSIYTYKNSKFIPYK